MARASALVRGVYAKWTSPAAMEAAAVVGGHARADRGRGGGQLDRRFEGVEIDRDAGGLGGRGQGLEPGEAGLETGRCGGGVGALFGLGGRGGQRQGCKEKQAAKRAIGHDPDLPFGFRVYTGAGRESP